MENAPAQQCSLSAHFSYQVGEGVVMMVVDGSALVDFFLRRFAAEEEIADSLGWSFKLQGNCDTEDGGMSDTWRGASTRRTVVDAVLVKWNGVEVWEIFGRSALQVKHTFTRSASYSLVYCTYFKTWIEELAARGVQLQLYTLTSL